MEILSLHDAGPPPPGQQQLGAPPPVPQLPPQMFTTAAQLLDLTDSESYRRAAEEAPKLTAEV